MASQSTKQTAKLAEQFLIKKDPSYFKPTPAERNIIKKAYETIGINAHKKAYDLIKVENNLTRESFTDPEELSTKFGDFIFIEVKGTNKDGIDETFNGFFFSVPESELKLAEDIGPTNYKFVLVNLLTKTSTTMTLDELLARPGTKYIQIAIYFNKPKSEIKEKSENKNDNFTSKNPVLCAYLDKVPKSVKISIQKERENMSISSESISGKAVQPTDNPEIKQFDDMQILCLENNKWVKSNITPPNHDQDYDEWIANMGLIKQDGVFYTGRGLEVYYAKNGNLFLIELSDGSSLWYFTARNPGDAADVVARLMPLAKAFSRDDTLNEFLSAALEAIRSIGYKKNENPEAPYMAFSRAVKAYLEDLDLAVRK